MRAFSDYNPVVVFVYFISAAGVAMFCMTPVIIALSFIGSLTLFAIRNGRNRIKSHLFFLLLLVVMALINPIFNHNGVTVLFFVNDNPVTLEALLYGVAVSVMIVSVMYWFRSFSQIMTSDKILYIFGSVSPKLSLVLSVALRYVPLLVRQTIIVNRTQRALGLYRDDNAIDTIRGGARVFSVMSTWALENGIITADSMTARGYGTGRRTFFSLYKFRKNDAVLLFVTLVLLTVTVIGASQGAFKFDFYPSADTINVAQTAIISYVSYAATVLLPSLIELYERLKWKYLMLKN